MHTRPTGAVTVQVDDLDAAVAAFGEAFAVEFERTTHPALGVPAAVSPVGTIVARTASSIPGPLADVAVHVDDVNATLARLTERGLTATQLDSGAWAVDFHGIPIHLEATRSIDDGQADGQARFDRAVLAVEDVHAASADLEAVFGIHLQIFDVDNMRIRVALGEDGIEFIGKMDPVIEIEQLWHWPISGFAVQVRDLDVSKQRMQGVGAQLSYEFTTPGGMPEVFYGRPGLHGVPITLMPWHEPGSLLETMGIDSSAGDVSPTIG
jgi:predicted enzyme related to lactoylglutathione lyase